MHLRFRLGLGLAVRGMLALRVKTLTMVVMCVFAGFLRTWSYKVHELPWHSVSNSRWLAQSIIETLTADPKTAAEPIYRKSRLMK